MADITYLTMTYPDFVLNDIINPDEFDENFQDCVDKVNEIIDVVNPLQTHTHDTRYYTEAETDAKYATKLEIADAVFGDPPDGSVTDTHLSNTAGQIKERVATHIADGTIHVTSGDKTSWNDKPTMLEMLGEIDTASVGSILYNYNNNGGAL